VKIAKDARKATAWERRQYEAHEERDPHEDSMREEYDFSGAVRGRYAGRFSVDDVMVKLEPDVARAFPDADAVNEALRLLLKSARRAAPAA
jgi:hypothetical protein